MSTFRTPGGTIASRRLFDGRKPKSAEMHPGPGFRIRTRLGASRPRDVTGLGAFETPVISDLMNRLYSDGNRDPAADDPDLAVVGPALTVKVFPGDNLMVHKSLDVAAAGRRRRRRRELVGA